MNLRNITRRTEFRRISTVAIKDINRISLVNVGGRVCGMEDTEHAVVARKGIH